MDKKVKPRGKKAQKCKQVALVCSAQEVQEFRAKQEADTLTKAELVSTLKGAGPFTVFAPTDDAFAAMEKATLDAALADPKGLLTEVLKYHVVSGKVMAADVVKLDGKAATTLLGKDVTVKVDGDKVILNGTVNVTKTDVECTNGVIHIIDAVMLPPAK